MRILRAALLSSAALGVLTLAITASAPAFAQVNLITNGSFETPNIGNTSNIGLPGDQDLNAGSTFLTDWTIGGANIDLLNAPATGWQADNGNQFVDLSGFSAGSVSQSFATTVGHTYTLFYDMSGNPNAGATIKVMHIDITGQSTDTETFDTTGHPTSNLGWNERSLSFIASSSTTALTFTSLDPSSGGPMLDNVRVFDTTPVAAPEPGALALVASVFPLVGGIAVRRRRTA